MFRHRRAILKELFHNKDVQGQQANLRILLPLFEFQ
jgi:hypothetical protein